VSGVWKRRWHAYGRPPRRKWKSVGVKKKKHATSLPKNPYYFAQRLPALLALAREAQSSDLVKEYMLVTGYRKPVRRQIGRGTTVVDDHTDICVFLRRDPGSRVRKRGRISERIIETTTPIKTPFPSNAQHLVLSVLVSAQDMCICDRYSW